MAIFLEPLVPLFGTNYSDSRLRKVSTPLDYQEVLGRLEYYEFNKSKLQNLNESKQGGQVRGKSK